jgi:lambda family phage portal protein
MKPLLYGPNNKPIRARNFDAAKGTRYTNDWVAGTGPADNAIKQDAKSLRDRARDSERNDGYIEGALMALESNVIGQHGIRMKSLARRADARSKKGLSNSADNNARAKVEEAWEDFSRRGNFDVTRQFSRAAFERLALRSAVRDGGFLTRTIEGFPKNDFRFAAQGIEIDALDPHHRNDAARIYMGVEFDEWDEPIKYHLRKMDPKSGRYTRETFAVGGDNMIHTFLARRINQSQGYSWLANALLRLRHLAKFEEAEVIAARISANKLGFFKQTGEAQYTGDEDDDGKAIAPSAPGTFETLPHGVEAQMIDPAHPNSAMPDFRKAILRGVSPGIYVNYNTWAQDLEGVSYSSIRQGVLSERDIYKILHSWFIDTFEIPLFERWLRMALLMGRIEGYTLLDFDRLSHVEFSGRTWTWVDPVGDIEAIEREIALSLNSRERAAKDRGLNIDKIIAENEQDNAKLQAAGLPTAVGKSAGVEVPSEAREFEALKAKFDAYGVGVRAGSITPQMADEDAFRAEAALPAMGTEAKGAWADDKGVRRPITLQSQAAFSAAQDALADESDPHEGDEMDAI